MSAGHDEDGVTTCFRTGTGRYTAGLLEQAARLDDRTPEQIETDIAAATGQLCRALKIYALMKS